MAPATASSRPIFVATHPRACSTAFERVRTDRWLNQSGFRLFGSKCRDSALTFRLDRYFLQGGTPCNAPTSPLAMPSTTGPSGSPSASSRMSLRGPRAASPTRHTRRSWTGSRTMRLRFDLPRYLPFEVLLRIPDCSLIYFFICPLTVRKCAGTEMTP